MTGSADSSKDGKKTSPIISLVAGGTAGGVEATLTFPFEFAKTRVQLGRERGQRNPFKVISDVFRKEGFRALYTGCSTLIVGTVGKDAIRFLSFDSIQNAFADPQTGTLTPLRSLGAGMAAGVLASIFAVTPTERIKTALIDDAQSATRRFNGPIHAIRTLVAENGPTALYRGFVTTTLKQATTTSVRLGSYNILKGLWKKYDVQQTTAMNFVNGAAAGTITVFTTQPFDVVKTRAQSAKGAGTLEATVSVMRDFGIRGYWRGSTMRLGRNVFSGAILFTVYEQLAAVLRPLVGGVGV